MIKRVSCFVLVLMLCICCTIPAYADNEPINVNLTIDLYDPNTDSSSPYHFATVYLPYGYPDGLLAGAFFSFDDLVAMGGKITAESAILHIQGLKIYDSYYSYMIALINSCSIHEQGRISTELEMSILESFIVDHREDEQWHDYFEACFLAGAFLLYSPDYEQYNPSASISFGDWFDQMNKTFLDEYFEYYNRKVADAGVSNANYNWYTYMFTTDEYYQFYSGDQIVNAIKVMNVYSAKNLYFDGGIYYDNGNVLVHFFNIINLVQIPSWFAWLPPSLLSTILVYSSPLIAILIGLFILKVVRG